MSDAVETLEQAADAGGILVHSWSLKDHAALVSAIRAVLKENERLRKLNHEVVQDEIEWRDKAADRLGRIEAALSQCDEIQKAEDMGERITAGYTIGYIRKALKGE